MPQRRGQWPHRAGCSGGFPQEPSALCGSPQGCSSWDPAWASRVSLYAPCSSLSHLAPPAQLLDFDLKDRKSIKWKYLGRKVEACLLVMRGKKHLITSIKVLTVCTAAVVLFCVFMPVLTCICLHQRWWDPTDVRGRLNSSKKQENKSLVLKYIFTYEAIILFGGKIKPPVLYYYLKMLISAFY